MWKIKEIRRLAILLLLLFSAQTAFALLTIKDPTVKDLAGDPVNGAVLELRTGATTSTPSPATPPYSNGTLYPEQFQETGSDGVTYATIPVTESGLTVVLKAWNGTPGPDSYYGFKSGSSGGTKDTFRWDPAKITTNYKAAPPYTPNIIRFEETSTTYGDGSTTATLKVVAAQPAASDGNREGSTYAWQMGVSGGTISDVAGATNATLTLSSDQVSAGVTYTFKVKCSGPWGSSDWAQKDYTVSGAGAAQEQITIELYKKTGDLGINTFALPFSPVYDEAGNPIATVADLVVSLNAVGEGYVSVVALWDVLEQKEIAFTFNDKGDVLDKVNTTDEPSSIAFNRARGYQLSVTEDKTVTLKNYQ
ncbi:hypothetical protein ACFL1W_00305 [Candidatus Margulisiibacteriota bacterium]